MKFQIDVQNKGILRVLEKTRQLMHRGGTEQERINMEIGDHLIQRIKDCYNREAGPDGKPWEPLAESTKASKDWRIGLRKILRRHQHMINSLDRRLDGDVLEVGYFSDANRGLDYPRYHEFGTKKKDGSKKMPARRTLFSDPQAGLLPQGDEDAIMRIVKKHFSQAFEDEK